MAAILWKYKNEYILQQHALIIVKFKINFIYDEKMLVFLFTLFWKNWKKSVSTQIGKKQTSALYNQPSMCARHKPCLFKIWCVYT